MSRGALDPNELMVLGAYWDAYHARRESYPEETARLLADHLRSFRWGSLPEEEARQLLLTFTNEASALPESASGDRLGRYIEFAKSVKNRLEEREAGRTEAGAKLLRIKRITGEPYDAEKLLEIIRLELKTP